MGPTGPSGTDTNVLTFRPGSTDTGPLIFNDFNDLYAELVTLRSAVGLVPNSGLFKILFDDQNAPLAGTVVLDSGPGAITYDMSYTEWIGALWSGGAYLADHGSVNLEVKDGGGEFDSLTIINALEFTGLNITGTGQDTVFDAQDGQVFRIDRTTFSGAGGQFVLDFIDVSGTIVLNDDSQLIDAGTPAIRVNNGVIEVRVNGENVYVNAAAIVSGVGGSVTAIINSSSAVYEVPIGITVNSLTMVSAAGLWSPDPNGVLSAEMGVMVSDPVTGFVWRNTDGVTAWTQFGSILLKDQPIAANGPSPSMQFQALVVNPAGTRCYVNGSGTDPIWYFSTATNLWNVATPPVTIPFSNARTLLFNLAGTKLYALAPNASTVSIIDPVAGTVTGTIAGLPAGVFSFMALNPSGTELWVSDISGPGSIHRVDTATDTFIATFASTAGNPFHLVFNPAGTKAYLNVTPNLGFSARLVIFDTTTYLPIATFSDTPVYRNLVALPDGTEVWSARDGVFPAPDEVIRISVATDLIVGVPILSSQANSSGPYQLIARADSSKVYSLLVSGDIDVITVASLTVTATVNTTSSFGGQIAINPANTFLYASNPQLVPYSVIVIDLGTELVSDTVDGSSIVQPAPITIGSFNAFRITGAQLSDDGGGQASINLPVVFDTAGIAFTNIKANRPFPNQSIDDQTKSGITNLGSGSTVSADYATIGGGTRNVASGDRSTVVGGERCTASGAYAVAGGGFCDATGDYSTAFGDGSLASGEASVALGEGCLASGSASFAMGTGAQALGDYSVAMGNGVQATVQHAVAFGNGCQATADGAFAFGDGSVASGQYALAGCEGSLAAGNYSAALNEGNTNGESSTALNVGRTAVAAAYSFAHGGRSDAIRLTQKAFASGSNAYGTRQTSELVLRGSTPGAAINETVELLFGGFAAIGSTQLILEDGKAYAFVITAVIGGVQAGPVRRSRSIETKFNARRDGGTTVITASGTTDAYGDASTATWTLTPTVGVAPDRIVLTFDTGAGVASDCEVVAKVEFTEVLY